MNRIVLFFSISLIFVSCANRKLGRQNVMLDPITITGKTAGLDIYRESAPRIWDITNTRIALSFDFKEKTADGRAWIDLHPYFYATDTLVLDAKSMRIDTVSLPEGNGNKILSYNYDDDQLKIKFQRPFLSKDTIQLYIRYKAMPYTTKASGSAAISEDRGLYFINSDNSIPDKPVQIWTQGETEANSHWMPTIDKPNERFTTRIELTVPDSFTTLSNGHLYSQVRAGSTLRTDAWVMEKPIQPYAVMFVVGNYSIVEDRWRGREVSYYVEPAYAPYAREMFKNTPEMMEYFSNITGVPYPWNKYSQVVVRDYVSGAMENTTASLFGEFMNQNSREIKDKDYEDIVSHELFHQWFGDYVTTESWSHLTVNESFANYGEQLWRRHKYGDASADELAFDDLWKYLSSASQQGPSLVRFRYSEQEEMFDLISYQKGGAILNYLHNLMGDSAFFKAMNIYLTKNALQPAEATHWRLAVEEATGRDWNWFFNQWYYRGGFPELQVLYDYDDDARRVNVVVTQKQDSLYILPLKAELIYGNTKSVADWNIRNRQEIFSYPYQNGVRPVIVPDAGYWLVGKITENKTPKEWLIQFANSDDNILSKHYAIGGIRKQLDDSSSQAVINLALRDKEVTIRELALLNLQQQKTKKWQDKWKADAAFLAVNDPDNKVRAAAFDVLGAWKINTSRQDMLNALSDSSYSVAGAALLALHRLGDDTVYALSKQILNTDPKGRLQSAAWELLAMKGNPADITLFEKHAPYFSGTGKIDFAHSLATYMEEVSDIAAFGRALDIYVPLTSSEAIRSYRLAIGSFFFQAAKTYKDRVRHARKNAEKEDAEKRLELMRQAASRILRAETSEDNMKQYRPAMKSIFGN